MRGGASPAAGVSNNKRDLAEREPMIMPKNDQRTFNHIVYNIPFLEASRVSSGRRKKKRRKEDKVFRKKYNPKANEMRECYNFILLLQVTRSRD